MLADVVDFAVGTDTHRDHLSLAVVVAATGVVVGERRVSADAAGYADALFWARELAPGRRVWAVEGTGSYGAGLTRELDQKGELVVEAERPKQHPRRGGKSDRIDAVRAARLVLSREHVEAPRAGGLNDSLAALTATRDGAVRDRTAAINALRALVVKAPEPIRQKLRDQSATELSKRCKRLSLNTAANTDRGVIIALKTLAQRYLMLDREARSLEKEIAAHVDQLAPQLTRQTGVGAITAAPIILAWSHPGRIRTEASFARLTGVAPIPASSGQTTRHRLDRGGDRRANRALHQIITTKLRTDPETQAYINRRISQGKSKRDATRCLKRYLARRLYNALEQSPDIT